MGRAGAWELKRDLYASLDSTFWVGLALLACLLQATAGTVVDWLDDLEILGCFLDDTFDSVVVFDFFSLGGTSSLAPDGEP